MSLIEIRHLKKEYPQSTPLKDVTADIGEGEVVSIIGPSGSGKSTLLRCINRLDTPTSGQILVDGIDVCDPAADLTAARRKMGMVFQSFNLFPHLLAVENIMLPLQKLQNMPAKEAYEEAVFQLNRVGLAGREKRYPEEMSGGQKQRLAIARALAMHPKIMLFDEPTSSLDPSMVSEVVTVIRELAESGQTMLIVTHEMLLARDVSSRVLFLTDGVVYEDGTPDQIFRHPTREKTRDFIFRIRSWEYEFSHSSLDMYEMLGTLEHFCARQFMQRRAAGDCQLAIEELVSTVLQPALERELDRNKGEQPQVRLYLNAGEEGREMTLMVDVSELPEGTAVLDLEDDDLAVAILKRRITRLPDTEQGIAAFRIRQSE